MQKINPVKAIGPFVYLLKEMWKGNLDLEWIKEINIFEIVK